MSYQTDSKIATVPYTVYVPHELFDFSKSPSAKALEINVLHTEIFLPYRCHKFEIKEI